MGKTSVFTGILASFLIAGATPAMAADGPPAMVSAADPAGIVKAMEYAGYKVKLSTDSGGDPMITTEFAGYEGSIFFYGCDEKTHKNCDSLQFQTAFNSPEPLDPTKALALVRHYRYATIWLDEEGDPFICHDLFTGKEISATYLLKSLDLFSGAVSSIGDEVF